MLILFLFMFCDYSITNRLPQPEGYVEQDWKWMQSDPNVMESYFRIYSEAEKEPHVLLVTRNYLEYNPLRKVYTGPVREAGRAVTYIREPEHYEIGNINGDDVVNLTDFAISAKYFKGGLYKPKPEPSPVPIEFKAAILKLLMDD